MTLAAATVVAAVATRLGTVVATGGRVYTARPWVLDEGDLPAWTVAASDETVEQLTVHWPRKQLHRLAIDAAVHQRAVTGIDTALHGLVADGLAALFGTEPPYQLALEGISRQVEDANEAATATHTLRLVAQYVTSAAAPETII